MSSDGTSKGHILRVSKFQFTSQSILCESRDSDGGDIDVVECGAVLSVGSALTS